MSRTETILERTAGGYVATRCVREHSGTSFDEHRWNFIQSTFSICIKGQVSRDMITMVQRQRSNIIIMRVLLLVDKRWGRIHQPLVLRYSSIIATILNTVDARSADRDDYTHYLYFYYRPIIATRYLRGVSFVCSTQ